MASEKRFDPTSRKLRKAREDGDVAKSRDFTAAVGASVGFACLFSLFFTYQALLAFFRESFSPARDFATDNMLLLLAKSMVVVLLVCGPVLILVYISVFFAEALQVGFTLSFKSLAIKFSRLNFFTGLKRLFGFEEGGQSALPTRLLYDITKIWLYLIGIGGVCLVVLAGLLPDLLFGDYRSAEEIMRAGYFASIRLAAAGLLLFFLCGTVDLLVSRRRRMARLRMDVEEFKKELRETEGNPEVKGMRKSLHQEMLLQGIIEGVRKARVVVVSKEGE